MTKKEIRADLIKQLETQGRDTKYFIDLVDDYMKYYDLKKAMQKDIKQRGLRYNVTSGNGFVSEKPNESIQNISKITTTMLKILQDLKLQEPVYEVGDDDYL